MPDERQHQRQPAASALLATTRYAPPARFPTASGLPVAYLSIITIGAAPTPCATRPCAARRARRRPRRGSTAASWTRTPWTRARTRTRTTTTMRAVMARTTRARSVLARTASPSRGLTRSVCPGNSADGRGKQALRWRQLRSLSSIGDAFAIGRQSAPPDRAPPLKGYVTDMIADDAVRFQAHFRQGG